MNRIPLTTGNMILKLAILILMSCGFLSCRDRAAGPEPESDPFVIENLGVVFGPWNRETGRAGDFLFRDIGSIPKIVSEFGTEVVAHDGSTKRLPTIDFVVREDAPVLAAAEGRVDRIFYQEGARDWEIIVRSSNDPDFEVIYDHLVGLRVETGDRIAPGDTLGHPRPLFGGLGVFELMVTNRATGLAYCPFCFFDPERIEEAREQLLRLIHDWETFRDDITIHDESAYVYAGCLMESMMSY